MAIFYLEVDQNEVFTFQSIYRTLSVLRQRIWLKLLWYVSEYPTAFPTQKKLALACQCSRSAISEALRIFQDFNWLVLISRGFKKSKILIIPPQYQAPELYQGNGLKKTSFVYDRATYKATPIKTNKKEEIKSSETAGNLNSLFEEELGNSLPYHLRHLNIPLMAKIKLSLVSDYAYQEALHRCKRMAKTGFKPKDQVAYLTATAINIAIQRGEHINWNYYYKTSRRCS